MTRPLLTGLIAGAALLGLADSLYLAHAALTGTPLACDVTVLSGCNIVAQSPYSRLLGIPLALYGVAFYAAIAVLAGFVWFTPKRIWYLLLYIACGLGFVMSMYFVLVQAFLINAMCIYCIISAVLATLLCALSGRLMSRFASEKPVVP